MDKFFYNNSLRGFPELDFLWFFYTFLGIFVQNFNKFWDSHLFRQSFICLFFLDSDASDSADHDYVEEPPKKKQKKASKKASKKKDLDEEDQDVSTEDVDVNDEAYDDYPPGKELFFFLIIFPRFKTCLGWI